jgi:branched-chain amino acid transport system substrate-binding protein
LAVNSLLDRRRVLSLGIGLSATALLAGCTTGGFDFGPLNGGDAPPPQIPSADGTLPPAAGQSFGNGPVRVALLLPLSGDSALANVGVSMANAAQLAIAYVQSSPKIGDNITLVLKDTGTTAGGAAQRASEAVSEGASLILGPLKADQVQAAGAVAKSAGIPLIGFSNNSGAASPGVYLLNVLPDVEIQRSLTYAGQRGKKAVAAIFPNSAFGRIQQSAFQQTVADLGLTPRAVYNFSSDAEAKSIIQQLVPQLKSGAIDMLFLPDRASAPGFGRMLQQAGISPGQVLIIGSADWDTDTTITATPALFGAIYPAVDDTGYRALLPEYTAKFGSSPHPLATIAYTAAILANAPSLALGTPRYDRQQLTLPGGFNGRDGVFRFLADGRSDYALIIKQVSSGGAQRVDGPKL